MYATAWKRQRRLLRDGIFISASDAILAAAYTRYNSSTEETTQKKGEKVNRSALKARKMIFRRKISALKIRSSGLDYVGSVK